MRVRFLRKFALVALLSIPLAVHAATYPGIEASFNIVSLATDPFDYTVTDVRVQIQKPDASVISLPAFFDGGTTWRVRHTPTNTGVYTVTGVTLNGSPQGVSNLQPASWTVSGRPVSRGYVRRDPGNVSRFVTSDGRRFYPVGQNVSWDAGAATVTNVFGRMGPSRENWARVWMNHWDGKNLDWPNTGAVLPRGQLNLTVARKWDSIISAAEQNGIYFQMTLQHHGQYSTTTDENWSSNPYNIAVTSVNGFLNTNGFLSTASQFFTNSLAKQLTKRKLRYAVARWGYSPSVMAWELFNEVQFTQAAQNGQWNIVGAWHDEMAQFLRSQDAYQHLITTSSEMNQPIWNEADYYQHHDYVSDYISALADPPGVPVGQPVKPVFGGESGRDNTTYYGQHAPLWSGIMGAQAGLAQPWYWDMMDAERCYDLMRAAADFVLKSGIAEQDSLVRSAPIVAGLPNASLVFAPGGGWNNAIQDTFTVGSTAPFGIGSLPSYLQGNFHRGMTPNGYTFQVNYSQPGTFAVQIVTVAASGAGLQLFLDGGLSNSIAFPATGSDVNTNFTLSINVPAGSHTINLWNPGLDWVNLGNITLNPYAPMLGAYQIGNTNFAAVWLWHRTNIYHPNATAMLTGTLPLAGLAAGNYAGTWWDTFAGVALSNFSFTVADTNPVNLPTPPVLRSLAFFAGKAPQAAISVSVLTQTLGTNSPALNVPLVITNLGGLPLPYSLTITGASPVAYTASSSTQPGGPLFAWQDISGVGDDISASFTQLAAPKTARDEGIAGPFNLGFSFPFFSGAQSSSTFTQVYVSPNGFITFSPFAGDLSTNTTLPNASAPTNLIALFWDDLDVVIGSATRAVYVDRDPIAGTFTVQYNNVRIKNPPVIATCQVILKSSGEILLQYLSLGASNTCTVGVQNAAANQGLQAAFNQNYVANKVAVQLTPTRWFGVSANAGLVRPADSESLETSLNPAGLSYGTYQATALVNTGDPTQPLFVLPIELNITPIATWRQTHFGMPGNSGVAADDADPDHDGLMNILEYAFNADPNVSSPPPISATLVGDHLTINFQRKRPAPSDLTYIYEVTDDLRSGTWQSGPVVTTQNVTDNLNGTETVTVIDNAPISATSAHYLRVRVAP